MTVKRISLVIACLSLIAMALVAGCICGSPGSPEQPAYPTAGPTPTAYITPEPGPSGTAAPTQQPGGQTPTPGSTPGASTPTPTPGPGASPTPTAGPPGIVSAELTGWGTDRDTYARGDTATVYLIVKNTGTAVIDQVDYSITAYRYIFSIPISLGTESYSSTGLGIQPGQSRRIEFSETIPAEYEGISTAGDYRFDVSVSVGGSSIGSFSKNVKVT